MSMQPANIFWLKSDSAGGSFWKSVCPQADVGLSSIHRYRAQRLMRHLVPILQAWSCQWNQLKSRSAAIDASPVGRGCRTAFICDIKTPTASPKSSGPGVWCFPLVRPSRTSPPPNFEAGGCRSLFHTRYSSLSGRAIHSRTEQASTSAATLRACPRSLCRTSG
jgi:hypothetical protein